LAHEAVKEGELDVHQTKIGGDSVDLGGFRQYVHRRNAGLQVEWAVEISKDSFTDRLNELLPDANSVLTGLTIGLSKFDTAFLGDLGNVSLKEIYEALMVYATEKGDQVAIERLKEKKEQSGFITVVEKSLLEGEVHIETFWIDIGGKRLLSMSYRGGNYLQLDSLDTEHTDFQKIITFIIQTMTTTDKVESTDIDAMSKIIDDLVPKISFETATFFPGKLRGENSRSQKLQQTTLIPISKGSRKEDLQNAMQLFLPRILQDIVLEFCQIAKKEINRLTYLGPLRSYPPRHIAFSQYHDPNWQAGGGRIKDQELAYSRRYHIKA
jgi:hypothetical protein